MGRQIHIICDQLAKELELPQRKCREISPRITPHAFRHTMATELVRNTGDLRIAQLVLGHRNLKTVQVYVHPSPADLGRAMDTIG